LTHLLAVDLTDRRDAWRMDGDGLDPYRIPV